MIVGSRVFKLLVAAFLSLDWASSFAPYRTHARKRARNPFRQAKNSIDGRDDDDGMIVEQVENPGRRDLFINIAAVGLLGAMGVASWQLFKAEAYAPTGFRRIPTQFIAALGDPKSQQGTNAKEWGLWRLDPGPRGVWLRDYTKELEMTNGQAPAGWKFDRNDWWLEEHGLIMEAPSFPVPEGRYLVTGGRSVMTGLTISDDGSWRLDEGTLYDVTHLPCRSARYKPLDAGGAEGSPLNARQSDFPVKPGAIMPSVPGTDKQDYAVLFLVGKPV